ncbi:sodium/proline symporter [Natrononativus amylolyticus]|uniref:sodium/proline symporter n=1 Tax=Natrononativus amylolyticus TaxID=2963434 RepID=UPI0020CFD2C7|nr:sodium/proline symporter [Natrononativus amylolyticus]
MSVDIQIWVGFSLYLLTVLGIGVYAYVSRPDETLSDYLLGDRSIGSVATAFTGATSVASGYQFVGLVGTAFAFGVSAFWFLVGDLIGVIIQYTLSPRLRAQSEQVDSITLVDHLSARVEDSNNMVTLVGGIIVLIFMTMYVASQMAAAGTAFTGIGGSYELGVVIAFVLILLYTLLGGYIAGAWTDVVQGVMMLVGLWAIVVLSVVHVGGWGPFVAELAQQDPALLTVTGGMELSAFLLLLGTVFGIGSGYMGSPHSMGRLMGTRDSETAAQSIAIAALVWVLIDMGSILVGWSVRAIVPDIADPEMGYTVMLEIFMHPLLAGVFVAALFAAIMSTGDSQLVAGVGAAVREIYHNVINEDADQQQMVRYSRIMVVVLSVVALAGALQFTGVVFWFILFAWAGVACVFAPLVVLSLYWRGLTQEGVVAGMITGSVTAVLWYYFPPFGLYEGFAAFIVSAVVAIGVSSVTQPPANTEEYFAGYRTGPGETDDD